MPCDSGPGGRGGGGSVPCRVRVEKRGPGPSLSGTFVFFLVQDIPRPPTPKTSAPSSQHHQHYRTPQHCLVHAVTNTNITNITLSAPTPKQHSSNHEHTYSTYNIITDALPYHASGKTTHTPSYHLFEPIYPATTWAMQTPRDASTEISRRAVSNRDSRPFRCFCSPLRVL